MTANTNTDNLQEVYLPQQLGFQQNGCEIVPMIVQLHLEQEPEHAANKLDNQNLFNEVMRHAALQFCASRPKLAPIMPALHALNEYGSHCTITTGPGPMMRLKEANKAELCRSTCGTGTPAGANSCR